MNPDTPNPLREELEARLTALLLGELNPDDAELLRKFIAQDPALSAQFERLKLTVELVRETAKDPIEQPAEVTLRLDGELMGLEVAELQRVAG